MQPNLSLNCPAHTQGFLNSTQQKNEKRLWLVIVLTLTTMLAEITTGIIYGSMALLADGWHMATHAGAMLISLLAYIYARKYLHDQRFTFGTGKLGDLAGFASAVLLALIAILMGYKSIIRLFNPETIAFEQSLLIAVIGLIINIICAFLLNDHQHNHEHKHQDNNLKAAYIHVLTDALTSITAITALLLGKFYGWIWADAAIGILGSIIIMIWAIRLLKDTGLILLDAAPETAKINNAIYQALAAENLKFTDLHVWKLSSQHFAAIISLLAENPKPANWYKDKLKDIHNLAHITIETTAIST